MTDAVADTPEPVQDGSEAEMAAGVAAEPDAGAAEPDHEGLLHELAGRIRDIPLPGRDKHVTGLLAWLADHHL